MPKRPILLLCVLSLCHAQTFEVAEKSIADEQKAMADGITTSHALVAAYLKRIEAFDHSGPKLNAILTVNPNALKEADALDRERATKGPRGPLHGIPVIVKDNYSTKDMPTTAGTIALLDFTPTIDAFQVRKLREAGAVIIAKANLHELASGITTISSAGGQTLNPYDPTRTPGGSSGGTAAAIAASFAAAGMGSDTCGSIRIPSSHNNLVGLRPTKGLSSIAGIVPLSETQDVGGPLARTVTDLAAMLDATIGEDPADKATLVKQTRPNFTQALQTGAMSGARIGTLEPLFGGEGDDQDVNRVVRNAIDEMKKAGAVIVPVSMPELNTQLQGVSLIIYEFKEDLRNYLAQSGNPPVHSLQEIVDNGLFHISLEAGFRRDLESKGRDSDEYRRVMEKRAAVAAAILKVMDEQHLDALVYPTMKRRPARISDPQGGSNCQLSPTTGFPAISMQAGFTPDGLPVGVELFGRPLDDAKLVSLAYAYEQATHHRRAPALTPALGPASEPITWKQSTSKGFSGDFTFNPVTAELHYKLVTNGIVKDDILAVTLHRVTKDKTGPVISLLPAMSGTETLSSIDAAKLRSGDLYLQISTRGNVSTGIRMPLAPN